MQSQADTNRHYPTPTDTKESAEYLTVWDLTEILGVSRSTVYRMLRGGELPFVRRGQKGNMRIRRTSFEAWRRKQERTK